MSDQQFVSLFPEDAVEGAGLPLDDADVILKDVSFVLWNYNGTQPDGPALRVVFVDGEDKEHIQYYSAGKIEKSVPSEDGTKLLPVNLESPRGLNKSTKAYAFLTSMLNADPGVRALLAEGNVKKLTDTRAHVQAVADKEKDGTTKKNAKGYDRTTILVSKIIALPGQKPAAAGAKAAKATAAAPAAAAAAPANSDIDDATVGYILGVLAANGGSVAKAQLTTKVFQAANAAKDANKSPITTRAGQVEFLKGRSEFSFDGTTVSIAA